MVNTRIDVTPYEWQRIKVLALEKGQPLSFFLAGALAKSPATKGAFTDGGAVLKGAKP